MVYVLWLVLAFSGGEGYKDVVASYATFSECQGDLIRTRRDKVIQDLFVKVEKESGSSTLICLPAGTKP